MAKKFDEILKLNAKTVTGYQLISDAVIKARLTDFKKNLTLYLGQSSLFDQKIKINGMLVLTKTYSLLQTFDNLKLDVSKEREFFNWLTFNDTYYKMIVNRDKRDNWKRVFAIAKKLVLHNSKKAKEYANLICAIAFVWDSKPYKMHPQMGSKLLSLNDDVTAYYDYFYDLYNSRKSKISYNKLSIQELIFVVDTFVPISELEWVRKNVDGKSRKWNKKYAEIVYDKPRLDKEQFNWFKGLYTLENIKKEGGICVDQAYYGVITAQAWGIPAIYFSGLGKRGGHAWFGFSPDGKKWTLDAGRYSYDGYTTGKVFNPQTRVKMNDHTLKFFFGGIKHLKEEELAKKISVISQTLLSVGNFDLAEKYLTYSFSKYPFYAKNWDLLLNHYKDNFEKQIELLNQKLLFYRKYPDIYIKDANKLMIIYAKLKKIDEVRNVETRLKRLVKNRDDLLMKVEYLKARRLYNDNKPRLARQGYEKKLHKFIQSEQEKIINPFLAYLRLTRQYGEAKEALEFAKKLSKITPTISQFLLEYANRSYQKSLKKTKKINKKITL